MMSAAEQESQLTWKYVVQLKPVSFHHVNAPESLTH